MTRKAIVVGSAGQDGQLLSAQLRRRGFEVLGCVRPSETATSSSNQTTIDICAGDPVAALVKGFRPDEIYFLAAYHHSAEEGGYVFAEILRRSLDVHSVALVNFLDAAALHAPAARLFYAASSHVFGRPADGVQDERTPINPVSAYGISKAAGLFACRHYRETHGLFASVGILYNHESELRAEKFLSRKIARGVAAVLHGEAKGLTLGNLDTVVDWGYAPDYTEAMQKILEAASPGDFVIASGKPHTVRDFARIAFESVGLNYADHVKSDPSIVNRDAGLLVGDPTLLTTTTGWRPTVDFSEMVRRLVAHEISAKDAPDRAANLSKASR
ncbi:GDP-mannose 4,6-dehydratase [Bradyrhizobium sp. NP1]|uniref:GDP-mannose 4,6-dehydratase n=1 Tax=Bradyrhizobium sp. NP1 TaxID=3049772 RepID=UPI0025A4FB57|nr:GDP-mannose 4,6-dehydratase [Bradyrhizobium sp. NP1]WJR76355.1 GDP-mannose 4,6-dehydratase [Bradyrhizobium sp. NP1]